MFAAILNPDEPAYVIGQRCQKNLPVGMWVGGIWGWLIHIGEVSGIVVDTDFDGDLRFQSSFQK